MKKWKLNRKFSSPLKRRRYLQFIYGYGYGYSGFPDNMTEQVQSYQASLLGYLENLNSFIQDSGIKFKDFQ